MRAWPIVLLALFAAASGWLLWQLREPDEAAPMVGPPRSDYRLQDFELIALDEAGNESFAARGPRLERHPELGTLDIADPTFVFPTDDGARWTSRADRAWVSRDGEQLQLRGDVRIDGPPSDPAGPVQLVSDQLTVYPKQNRVETAAAVTVTEPGSILRGRGMRADLDARRVELLSEVRIRHEPPR